MPESNKNHQSYLIASFISILGDMIGILSISWWVISLTESTITMASILAPSIIARIVGGPIFGTIADFISRKKIMIVSDLLSSVMWGLLFLYYISGHFNPVLLSVFFFMINLLQSLLKAAAGGMLADLGSVENLIRKIQASSSFARILGAACGALFLQLLGGEAAIIFNVFTFLIAAYFVNSINIVETFESKKKLQLSGFLHEFLESFKYMKKFPFLIFITVSLVFLQFSIAGFPVILPSFAKLVMKMPPWYLGLLEISLGLGILLGTMVIMPLVKRRFPDRGLELGVLMMSIGAFIMTSKGSAVLPVIGILLIQAGFVTGIVPLNSKMIMSLPSHLRSRVSSLIGSIVDISAFVGLIITSFCFSHFGYVALFGTIALFYFVFFLLIVIFKDKKVYAI